jgi:hypothetical protein
LEIFFSIEEKHANRAQSFHEKNPYQDLLDGPVWRVDGRGCWEHQARMDQRDRPDRIEPTLANEPTESTEASEPAEPIDNIEPADPIDRIEPVDPMDKMDPLEPMLRIDPAEPGCRGRSPLRINPFSQPRGEARFRSRLR